MTITRPLPGSYNLAVIGAGIAGLAHAYAAARLGKRVVIVDREAHATGASVRGYGLNLTTGQSGGLAWHRTWRSREILLDIASQSGIWVEQRGLMTVALRPEGLQICEQFCASEMGTGCQILTPAAARKRVPILQEEGILGALWSPHELRYDGSGFCGNMARWLVERLKVHIVRGAHVRSVFPTRVDTSAGPIRAEAVIVCPGDEMLALFAHRISNYRLTRCRMQMLRLVPGRRIRLPTSVQSDLGLLALPGFSELPGALQLANRLTVERRTPPGSNFRMLAVQANDRSLIVGDSRMTAPAADPFLSAVAEQPILDEFDRVLDVPERVVAERWIGVHAVADRPLIVDRPSDAVRLVMLTGNFGASSVFAVAEEVVADLFGSTAAAEPEVTSQIASD